MNPANRPAETGGIAGGVAILVGHILGINDPGTLAAMAVVIGFAPAAITWIVTLLRKPHPDPAPPTVLRTPPPAAVPATVPQAPPPAPAPPASPPPG